MQSLRKIPKKPNSCSLKVHWLTYLFKPLTFIHILRTGINFIGQDCYAVDWAKKGPNPVSACYVENS
jgi:hypothetical protein